jgi:tripartite-type tricarboxylate transporter receptor subunit TctC
MPVSRWITCAAAALVWVTTGTVAADYPEKPVKVIVPFQTGGMSDTTARIFQKSFERGGHLGQPLTIVNMGGGGGTIGTRATKEAEADGHTIMLIHLALLSAQAMGVADYGHEAFEPIAQTGSSCLVTAVRADAPYETLEDLFEAARAAPDTIVEAVNIGAVVHIASLILSDPAGTSFRYMQSGGGAKRIQDLVGGHAEVAMFSTSEYKSFQPMGIKALAILAPERHPDFPGLPTAKEQGYDVNFCVDNWWFAPAGTPEDRVEALADAFAKAMEDPEVVGPFEAQTISPTFLRGEELAAHVAEVDAQIQAAAAKAR